MTALTTPQSGETIERALDRLSLSDAQFQSDAGQPRGVPEVAGLQDVVESLRELIGACVQEYAARLQTFCVSIVHRLPV